MALEYPDFSAFLPKPENPKGYDPRAPMAPRAPAPAVGTDVIGTIGRAVSGPNGPRSGAARPQGAQPVPGYTSSGEMDQQAATYTASAPSAAPKLTQTGIGNIVRQGNTYSNMGQEGIDSINNARGPSNALPSVAGFLAGVKDTPDFRPPMAGGVTMTPSGAVGSSSFNSPTMSLAQRANGEGPLGLLANSGGGNGPYFPQLQGRGPQTSELTDAIRATSDIINQYKGRSDWTSREMTAKAIDRLANLQSAQTQAFQAGTGAQQANTQQMYQVGPNGQGGMLGVERERAAMMAPYYAGAGQGSLLHGQAALGQAITQRQVSAPQVELNNRVVELLAAGKPDEAMQLMRASKGEFNTMQIPVATGTYVSPPPPNGTTQFYPMAPGMAGGTPTTLPR